MTRWIFLALALLQQPETMSLLGQPLFATPLPKAERVRADAALAEAHAVYQRNPSDPAAILGFARATLAVGRVGDTLEILTHGIEANPNQAALLLERGRGYIIIRKFDVAERDLRKAAASLPAAACDLGLARYLAADYARARESYAGCADPGIFGYLAARRAGAAAEKPSPTAAPPPAPPAIRLPGSVTRGGKDTAPTTIAQGYVDAIERLLDGDENGGRDRLKRLVEKNRRDWMDPVYIAAEAEYARLRPTKRGRQPQAAREAREGFTSERR